MINLETIDLKSKNQGIITENKYINLLCEVSKVIFEKHKDLNFFYYSDLTQKGDMTHIIKNYNKVDVNMSTSLQKHNNLLRSHDLKLELEENKGRVIDLVISKL